MWGVHVDGIRPPSPPLHPNPDTCLHDLRKPPTLAVFAMSRTCGAARELGLGLGLGVVCYDSHGEASFPSTVPVVPINPHPSKLIGFNDHRGWKWSTLHHARHHPSRTAKACTPPFANPNPNCNPSTVSSSLLRLIWLLYARVSQMTLRFELCNFQ